MFIIANRHADQLNVKVCKSDFLKSSALRAPQVKKLKRIIQTNYLEPRYVKWDIRCFRVPKGENNIRLVYNSTWC